MLPITLAVIIILWQIYNLTFRSRYYLKAQGLSGLYAPAFNLAAGLLGVSSIVLYMKGFDLIWGEVFEVSLSLLPIILLSLVIIILPGEFEDRRAKVASRLPLIAALAGYILEIRVIGMLVMLPMLLIYYSFI